MMRQHKAPCAHCPFRRRAAPGWLGGSSPGDFLAMAMSEARMPCHGRRPRGVKTVDYEAAQTPGTKEHSAPQCVGRAVFWRNQCKSARVPGKILEAQTEDDAVFRWTTEFTEHHSAGALAEKEEAP